MDEVSYEYTIKEPITVCANYLREHSQVTFVETWPDDDIIEVELRTPDWDEIRRIADAFGYSLFDFSALNGDLHEEESEIYVSLKSTGVDPVPRKKLEESLRKYTRQQNISKRTKLCRNCGSKNVRFSRFVSPRSSPTGETLLLDELHGVECDDCEWKKNVVLEKEFENDEILIDIDGTVSETGVMLSKEDTETFVIPQVSGDIVLFFETTLTDYDLPKPDSVRLRVQLLDDSEDIIIERFVTSPVRGKCSVVFDQFETERAQTIRLSFFGRTPAEFR